MKYTWTFKTDGTWSGTAIDVRHIELNEGREAELYIN